MTSRCYIVALGITILFLIALDGTILALLLGNFFGLLTAYILRGVINAKYDISRLFMRGQRG